MVFPSQHPLYLIIITFLTLLIILLNSIQNERILKKSLFLTFINLATSIVVYFVYELYFKNNDLMENIYLGYTIFTYFLFILTFLITFSSSVLKANHYQLFVKSLRESSWNAYYIVDKRERVKDISESLLNELGLEKDQVIGKRLFDIFDRSIRFLKLNDADITNKTLKGRYKDYRKTAKLGDSEVEEIIFSNHEGKETVLKVMMQPVFVFGKYRGRTVSGEIRSDFSMLGVEKKLNKNIEEYNSVSQRLGALLQLSEEGLYQINLEDKTIGISPSLSNMLKLSSERMSLEDFRALIEPSDLSKYLIVLSELNYKKPKFEVKYRILVGGKYMWVREKGIRLFSDSYTSSIMGTIKVVPTTHFRTSNIDVLDRLEDSNNLIVDLNRLIAENKRFYLMLFEVSNLPEINDKHGWQVGNMFLANFVEYVKNNFITENGKVYRVSGLLFAAVITAPIKMNIIKEGSLKTKDFFDLDINYGSIHEKLIIKAGLSVSEQDGNIGERLYEAANQALMIAKNPRFTHNVTFYEDIVDYDKK